VSQAQQTRVVNLPAARGMIVDAKQRPLAAAGAQLAVVAEASALGPTPLDASWQPSASGRRTLAALSKLAHVSTARLVARVRASLVQSPFAPSVIVPHAPRALTFYLDERAEQFPGLHVVELPTRSCARRALGGEFLGLLGQVSAVELKQKSYAHAKAGRWSGSRASGDVRPLLERRLRARARAGELDGPDRIAAARRAYEEGTDGLQLTIDARIQRAALRAVKDGIAMAHTAGYTQASSGAAVVLDQRDGAVKALVSYPGVNQLAAAQDPAYLASAHRQDAGPPEPRDAGSVPGRLDVQAVTIVAEAALASGLITPSEGVPAVHGLSLTVGNIVFHNVEPSINQSMNLAEAIEMSCDTWFYRLGEKFYFQQERGSLAMQQWAHWLGLGHPTGIDVPGEAAGVVPTPAWLRQQFAKTSPSEAYWYEGTSVNLSIGQGYLEVTPLQMAVAYAALANGGTVVRPHVAQAVLGAHRKVLRFPPVRKLKLHDAWAIHDGLFRAAHGATGTSAAIFGSFPVPVAGKTGTAQDPHGDDDSWYASWAPAGNPRSSCADPARRLRRERGCARREGDLLRQSSANESRRRACRGPDLPIGFEVPRVRW
jgi:penicillin-binding protein 2